MNIRPDVELLSPAANAEIGIEAINHGADAVYIGGPAFGARVNAANSVADIERLVRHAHRYHARIFVTLNTILREEELAPAVRLAHDLHAAGVDALIVQDMGLLECELPPFELHASTQTDIRTPEKARFLQDVGFSQIVLARELSLEQIRAIAQQASESTLEFFVHGALCVAYSGQCYISHAHTGRSANRGDCSQACRLPYTLTDDQGRIFAHDRHLLSMKDNDQSANLEALIDAGVRSFKIEGRYKDLGYVKNVTAHYRRKLDEILERRMPLRAASSGNCRFFFEPDPARNFHRGSTDYFVSGRQPDIGALDSPKFAGTPIGHATAVAGAHFELETTDPALEMHNGDGLTYYDLQGTLVGVLVNRAQRVVANRWRIEPNDPIERLPDLRPGTELARNRDRQWLRVLEGRTAERRIALDWEVGEDDSGLWLRARDADGCVAQVPARETYPAAHSEERALQALEAGLARLGNTLFVARGTRIAWRYSRFLPAAALNAWRRETVEALEAVREAARPRPRRAVHRAEARYPDDSLSYLGNVANSRAAAFYRRHGVIEIEPAYESHAERGDVSLMVTRHCVRYSLSLCPKQAKGVIGVQGTVRAEPLSLVSDGERLTLRFDCKACEMHVFGRIKPSVLAQTPAIPVTFVTRGNTGSRPPSAAGD